MDLCGKCHHPVKSTAEPCPNCGYMAKKGNRAAGIVIASVVGVIVILFILNTIGVINLPI